MEVRTLPDRQSYRRMTTGELRDAFLLDRLFRDGEVNMVYVDADRAVVGGAVPADRPLRLEASRKEMAADSFLERREIGIVNIGAQGSVRAGATVYTLDPEDMFYAGKGVEDLILSSADPARPARFYFVSFPAHASYPAAIVRAAEAHRTPIGTAEGASKRTIRKYIHPGGARSCQLVMGLTELDPGCVWNTMPPHTHIRRSEVYLYYGLGPDDAVVHMMGTPEETRSLMVRNEEAVVSPPWSIHCGAATRRYSFIWAMGGENQEFADMDPVGVGELK